MADSLCRHGCHRIGLVGSIFPGIDLLGRAFEEEVCENCGDGDCPVWCIVRGPDLLWGGDVRTFHPPTGVFEGVIGGPPCQHWTRLMFLNPKVGNGMEWVVSEFARVVEEASPAWFLMEEVPYAPMPLVNGYHLFDWVLTDQELGGIQPRQRRFTFGTPDGRMLFVQRHEPTNGRAQTAPYAGQGPLHKGTYRGPDSEYYGRQSVLADGRAVPVRIGGSGKEKRSITADGRTGNGGNLPHEGQVSAIEDACEAMGLPRDFTAEMPFTMHGKRSVIGNGVPMAMGRAMAKAVRKAMRPTSMASERGTAPVV